MKNKLLPETTDERLSEFLLAIFERSNAEGGENHSQILKRSSSTLKLELRFNVNFELSKIEIFSIF